MQCHISEKEVDPAFVSPPAMNYGQHWRWEGFPVHQYRYVMPAAEFMRIAGEWFDRCRVELEDDQYADPPGTFPELDAFADLGFPALPVMLQKHPAQLASLMCWQDLELVNQFAGTGRGAQTRYSVNSLEWFRVDGDQVSFGGIAYEMSHSGTSTAI